MSSTKTGIICLLASCALSAVTNVTVQTTHRQAVIAYVAPAASACTLSVYTDSAMTAAVNDTSTALFGSGANLDTRTGSVSLGRARTFVVGQIPLPGWTGYSTVETTTAALTISSAARATNVSTITTSGVHGLYVYDHVTIAGVYDSSFNAVDAVVLTTPTTASFTYANVGSNGSSSGGTATRVNRFSRTLQADTQHWYRIACGGDTYDGTFRTANVPLGSTYGELTAFDWSSAPMKYLYPAIPEVRPYTTIDPVTGIAAHRASLTSDYPSSGSTDYPTSFDAGSMISCPQEKTNAGYHCTVQTAGMSGRLYWYGDNGTVRHLGYLRYGGGSDFSAGYAPPQASWDTNAPNRFWVMGGPSYSASCLLALDYWGNDVARPPDSAVQWSATNMTPSAAGKSLLDLIHDFDSRFSTTTYTSCGVSSVQGDYLTGMCRSMGQDSPGWIWALYLGDRLPLGSCSDCLRIVAAAPTFGNATTRWCGYHAGEQLPGFQVESFVVQALLGGAATGPWEVILQGNIDASTQSITVDGEPVSNIASRPWDGSSYLQDAAIGDAFLIGSERVKITGKSGTAWTVTRGYASTTPASHTSGDAMRAVCEPIEVTGLYELFWKYLSDPHGTDASNAYWIHDSGLVGAHRVARDPWNIMAGWYVRHGSFPNNNFDGPATFLIPESPKFAGTAGPAPGNSYQKHPAFENWNAPDTLRRNWFNDGVPFQGDPVITSYALVGGTTYIYRITPPAGQIDVKHGALLGLRGKDVLLDISGPGSALTDTTGDAHKFCVAYAAGECRGGSSAGEVFANLPSASGSCGSGSGFCVFHASPYGQAIMQFGLDGKSHRALIRGLAGPFGLWGLYTNGRATPDGKWLIFPTAADSGSAAIGGLPTMLAAIPDTPAWESTNRTDFVPVMVSLGGLAGATKTIVEFGYAADGNYRCTQRAETCVAAASAYVPATPYYFATVDTYTGVDCSSGCTIVVPAISGRVVYWRVKYRDAGGNAMAVTPPQIVVAP
jgi:hypothetical protein